MVGRYFVVCPTNCDCDANGSVTTVVGVTITASHNRKNLALLETFIASTQRPAMNFSEHKGVIAIFMLGGFGAGSLLEPLLANKQANSLAENLGIGSVVLLLLFWNVLMYRKAAKLVDPEFPASALERYMRPGFATVCFLAGFFMVVIPSLSK
jgi:hypothetical protein